MRRARDYDSLAIATIARTDQPPEAGGEGSAPPPFDLFLASIATCAGIYVKGYCDARGLATEGLGLVVHVEREPGKARVTRIGIDIKLPPGFPEKHREAVIRAADLCAVKKHIMKPPAFEVRAVEAGAAPGPANA